MPKDKSRQSRRTTPWDIEDSRTPTQQFLYEHYHKHYQERHPVLIETGEERLINSYIPSTCPYCGESSFQRYGQTRNKIQRYRCNACTKTFTPVTGTIFDQHKISISEWMEYTLNILRYVSVNADSWNNKNAYTTSRYWLEKLFLILEASQANVMLSGRVWLDETYYTVELKDLDLNEDGTKPRGLSRNQLCIGVACTESQILCLFEGNGQPSKKKTYAAFKLLFPFPFLPCSRLQRQKPEGTCRLRQSVYRRQHQHKCRRSISRPGEDLPRSRYSLRNGPGQSKHHHGR